MRVFIAISVAVALWFGVDDWRQRSIEHPPGVLAPDIPEQRDLPSATPLVHAGYTLTPRAEIRVTARVLAGERYRFSRAADLMPRDLALGWGVMSDSAVLDQSSPGRRGIVPLSSASRTIPGRRENLGNCMKEKCRILLEKRLLP